MQSLGDRFGQLLQNLPRIHPILPGDPTASAMAAADLPMTDKNLIPRFMLTLSIGLLLVLSGCGPAVTPPVVEQPRAKTVVVPAGPTDLLVDHAWVKDAGTRGEQAARRKAMETLHAKVVAGGTFLASWDALGVDGAVWHVAEHETYPSDVVPEGARNLPIGSISPILPGDGGLHLFRILGREAAKQVQ